MTAIPVKNWTERSQTISVIIIQPVSATFPVALTPRTDGEQVIPLCASFANTRRYAARGTWESGAKDSRPIFVLDSHEIRAIVNSPILADYIGNSPQIFLR